MPGMDGFETAALIRERDRSRHTPIIFLTAFQSTEVAGLPGLRARRGRLPLQADRAGRCCGRRSRVFVELFQKTEQVKRQAAQLRREPAAGARARAGRGEAALGVRAAPRGGRPGEAGRRGAGAEGRGAGPDDRRAGPGRGAAPRRAAQQAIVAELGQRALAGDRPARAAGRGRRPAARNLGSSSAGSWSSTPEARPLALRAGVGWAARAGATAPSWRGDRVAGRLHPLADEPVVVETSAPRRGSTSRRCSASTASSAALSVVIHGRDRPFGTLGVFSREPRAFTRDDVHFLQAVANVLAAAIQRKRDEDGLAAIRDELAVQLADMTRLHALSARLSNSLELPTVLEEVLAAVTGLQGTDRGVLMLHDRERDVMIDGGQRRLHRRAARRRRRATPTLPARRAVTAVISGGHHRRGHRVGPGLRPPPGGRPAAPAAAPSAAPPC